jgi:hypothetical protein
MRYLKTFVFILCLFIVSNCFSQESNADVMNVFKITILNPGISYEKAIMKYQAFYAQAFINFSATLNDEGPEETIDINFYVDPAITAQYRFYYNFNKRANKSKRVEGNSANYFAADYEGIFSKLPISDSYNEEIDRRLLNRIGAVWGFQRNYKSKFSLDFNVGLGYMFGKSTEYDFLLENNVSNSQGQITLLSQINIGFWLSAVKPK